MRNRFDRQLEQLNNELIQMGNGSFCPGKPGYGKSQRSNGI